MPSVISNRFLMNSIQIVTIPYSQERNPHIESRTDRMNITKICKKHAEYTPTLSVTLSLVLGKPKTC
jgi:hypothetical protein